MLYVIARAHTHTLTTDLAVINADGPQRLVLGGQDVGNGPVGGDGGGEGGVDGEEPRLGARRQVDVGEAAFCCGCCWCGVVCVRCCVHGLVVFVCTGIYIYV